MALELREKRLLMIPVALAAVLGFYNFVHVPIFAKRAEAAEQYTKVSTDLKTNQTRLAKEGNLQAREEAVAARERVLDTWVPGKNSASLFIWYLSQAELHSGARIKGLAVGERKQVKVTPQQGAGASTPGNDTQGTQGNSAQSTAGEPAPTLTVLQLNLKVDAMFAQHLLFNQALEEMPLFLNTDSLGIEKPATSPSEQVGKLVADGNAWLAAQVLGASPNLNGTYQINLYFKQEKVGPTTDPMQFSQLTGRSDPFAMASVDDFLQALVDYYTAAGPGGSNTGSGQPAPTRWGTPGQMG
jgi:hypothetical protein